MNLVELRYNETPVRWLRKGMSVLFQRRELAVPIWIGLAGIYAFLRIAAVLPSTLADEYIYSTQARLGSLWESSTYVDPGNYLFSFVYSSTNLCGEFAYSCSKLINTFWLVLLAILVFTFVSSFLSWGFALALAVLTIVSPIGTYASVFMPETMFAALIMALFLAIWWAITKSTSVWAFALVGLINALAILTKPHALMLIPTVALTILVLNPQGRSFAQRLSAVGTFALTVIAGRVALGLILGGPRSLNILGSYAATIDSNQETAQGIIENTPILERFLTELTRIGPNQLYIHSTGFWLTMSFLVLTIFAFAIQRNQKLSSEDLSLATGARIALLMLFSLMALSFAFTIVATAEGDDHIDRYLARYFEFLIPLLTAIFVVIAVRSIDLLRSKVSILFVWAPVAIGTVVFSPLIFGQTNIMYSDSVWSAAALSGIINWWVAALVPLVALILAALVRDGGKVLTAFLVASALFLGHFSVDQMKLFRGQAITADAAGMFANDYIGEAADGRTIAVLANSRFTAASAAFWIEKPNVQVLPIAPGALIEIESLSEETDWVLIIGEIADRLPTEVRVAGVGFQLIKISNAETLDFYPSRPRLDSWALGIQGEYAIAPWGVWLESSPIKISTVPLPTDVSISIDLKVSPALAGKPIIVSVGDSQRELLVQHSMEIVTAVLDFTNVGGETQIEISGQGYSLPRIKGFSEGLEHEMIQDGAIGIVNMRLIGIDYD